jgi:hypothetical protein
LIVKPGPYLELPVAPGLTAPFYALRFDKAGRAQSPLTQQHLVDTAAAGDFTDVYVFSHGWNNDWETALGRYRDFIAAYQALRETHQLTFDREYRPLLVGIFWPSTALVLPWEQGPQFAGADGAADADAIDLSLLPELAAEVEPGELAHFYELAEQDSLGTDDARALLELVLRTFAGGDPDVAGDPARDVDDALAAWAKLEAAVAPQGPAGSTDDFGAVGARTIVEPEAAGFLDRLDPRTLFRGMTVWQMKDRAGAVGANGVAVLLTSTLGATSGETRFHLVGHSFGARLLLAAILQASHDGMPRPVDSLLLLQPAVNHLCFADALPTGRPGGFREVLAQVEQPILSTFSSHDFPLGKTFHLALRRGKDLGEVEIAADEPPSEYAALGGYGPRGFDGWQEVTIKDPLDPYDLGDDAPEVWAVNGSARIAGHGAVVNEATAWALFNLAKG